MIRINVPNKKFLRMTNKSRKLCKIFLKIFLNKQIILSVTHKYQIIKILKTLILPSKILMIWMMKIKFP